MLGGNILQLHDRTQTYSGHCQKNDQITKIPFDYGEVEKGKNLEQNILLQPGDVVVVP